MIQNQILPNNIIVLFRENPLWVRRIRVSDSSECKTTTTTTPSYAYIIDTSLAYIYSTLSSSAGFYYFPIMCDKILMLRKINSHFLLFYIIYIYVLLYERQHQHTIDMVWSEWLSSIPEKPCVFVCTITSIIVL